MSCSSIWSQMRHWAKVHDHLVDFEPSLTTTESEYQRTMGVEIDNAEANLAKLYEQGVMARCFGKFEGERVAQYKNRNSESYHDARGFLLQSRISMKPAQSIEGLKGDMICRTLFDQMRYWTQNYRVWTKGISNHDWTKDVPINQWMQTREWAKGLGSKISVAENRLAQLYEVGVPTRCFHKLEKAKLTTDHPDVEAYYESNRQYNSKMDPQTKQSVTDPINAWDRRHEHKRFLLLSQDSKG